MKNKWMEKMEEGGSPLCLSELLNVRGVYNCGSLMHNTDSSEADPADAFSIIAQTGAVTSC